MPVANRKNIHIGSRKLKQIENPSHNQLLQVGGDFGRFKVLELLGQGGMGQIFRVQPKDDPTASPLALKVIDSPNLSKIDRLRFEREFQLASRFDHPNLVKVYEFGSHQGTTYFTMEWVKGADINQAFTRALSESEQNEIPAEAIKWMDDILAGLEVLHEAGIVHRDIKPENVLIDLNGCAKLLDLGLASHFKGAQSDSRLTQPGAVLGTVHYMPPEQVIGGEIDVRSDLYSLGVVMYEWFSGELPFDGPDPLGVLGKILHQSAPPLKPRLPLPNRAIDLVMSLLSRNVDDRPASATQVRKMWQSAFGSLTSSAELEMIAPALDSLPLPPRHVGRDELTQRAQLELLDEGSQGLKVVFTGPAGMGKTRALQSLQDWAKRQRWKVLHTVASPLDTLPFQPLLEPLRMSLHFGVPESLASFKPELSLILPELTVPGSEVEPDLNPLRKYRLFEGMRRVLLHDRRKKDRSITFLTIEDLQHAGDETLEFLHFLRQQQSLDEERRLLVAATLGAGFEDTDALTGRLHQTLTADEVSRLHLEPLGLEPVRQLVLSMLGGGKLEELSLRALQNQSGGNPLFLIEMVRIFLEEKRLTRHNRNGEQIWHLRLPGTSEPASSSTKIPDSLKSVVAQRLKPLSTDDRELLKRAAFLGLRFRFTLLAAVADRTEAEVLDRLLYFAQKGLVKEGHEGDTFDFCNSILPAVLLDSVSATEKRQIHLQICDEAVKRHSEVVDPFWLAWHYRQAGERLQALQHLLTSADRAFSSFSFTQAAALYREILTEPEKLKEIGLEYNEVVEKEADALRHNGALADAEVIYRKLLDGPGELSSTHKVRLQQKIASIKGAQGDPEASLITLKKAWEGLGLEPLDSLQGTWRMTTLLKTLTAPDMRLVSTSRVKGLSQGQANEVAALAIRLQRALFFVRPPSWVRQAVEVALVQRQVNRHFFADKPDLLTSAHVDFNSGYLCLRLPKGWQSQSLRLLNRAADKAVQSEDPFARLELLRDCGYLLHLAGRSSQGQKLLNRAASEAEKVGHLTSLPQVYAMTVAVTHSMGLMDEAEEAGWKGYHLATALENQRDLVFNSLELALVLLTLRRLDEAQPFIEEMKEVDFSAFPYLETLWIRVQVEKELCQDGRVAGQRALELVDEGLKMCREMDELRFLRRVFQVKRVESLLAANRQCDLDHNDWTAFEQRLRSFPHLRFDLKLLKLRWMADMGVKTLAANAEKLRARPECQPFHRDQIESLLKRMAPVSS